jgi:putative ABC transport system ATP-binding protein
MEVLRTVALKPGRAVIIVTHDNRIFPLADRILSMEDGRIVTDGPAASHDSVHHFTTTAAGPTS